jgi:hypothetical protein
MKSAKALGINVPLHLQQLARRLHRTRSPCCAPAASGHAADAPPMSVMNSLSHDSTSGFFPLCADRWRARARPRGCGSATTSFFTMTPRQHRVRASAAASRSWSPLSTPTLIGCAITPATFSARPNGTGAAGPRTGCCQATISPRQRPGRRAGPRVRPNPQLYTSTSSARVKRRRRRD